MDFLDNFIKEKIKGGHYQARAVILLALINTLIGAFMSLTNIFTPEIQTEFKLSVDQISALISFNQIGALIGATTSAESSHRLGRVNSVLLGMTLQVSSCLLLLLINSIKIVALAFFVWGLYYMFCLNAASTFAAEIIEPESRGKWMVLLVSAVTLGRITGTILCFFLMQTGISGSWKKIVALLTVFLVLLAIACFLTMTESLRFLLSKNEEKKFLEACNKMIVFNNRCSDELSQCKLILEEEVKGLFEQAGRLKSKESVGTYADFFSLKYLKINVLLAILWSVAWLELVGQNVILPYWFGNQLKGLSFLLLTFSAEIPSMLAGVFIIDHQIFGRRRSIQMSSLIVTVFTFASFFAESNQIMTLLFWCARFGIKGSFLFLMPYTTEVYPTPLRGIGMSFSNVVGGFLNCFLPFIIMSLFHWNRHSIFVFLGFLGLLSFSASLFLTIETAKKSLDIELHHLDDFYSKERKWSALKEKLIGRSNG